jgi:hypothetical protein
MWWPFCVTVEVCTILQSCPDLHFHDLGHETVSRFFEMSLTARGRFNQRSSGHPHVDEVCASDEAKDHRADGQGREAPQEMSLVLLSQDTIAC